MIDLATSRVLPRCSLALILSATAVLYVAGLDRAPVYIGGDEAHFASHAHAIANTGRDLNGTRLPLFVQITDLLVPNNSSRVWYQPALFYLLAADLRVLPFNETSVRLPTALIGVLNVLLIYLVGRRMFGARRYGLLAAAMLAMTPAQLLLSRQALDYICPLPVVLTWLWCVLAYEQRPKASLLALTGLLLGLGMFTYIASWATMPLLAVLTVVALRPALTQTMFAGVMMMVPLLLVVPWLWSRPQVLIDTIGRYRIEGARSGATRSLLDFNLGERITLYWDYFNPSFLFFAGGSNPTIATSRVGVFLLPIALFLAVGIARIARRRDTGGMLALAGILAAPLPIVLMMPAAPGYSIARALTMVPFVVLVATAGAQAMFASTRSGVRITAAALVLAMPLQFAAFVHDYFIDYQRRSAARFDPVATRDLMEKIVELDQAWPAPQILFNDELDDKSVRWRFYALSTGRYDLWERATYFNAARFEPNQVPSGSLLVLYSGDPRIAEMVSAGTCTEVARLEGFGGQPAAAVLRRR